MNAEGRWVAPSWFRSTRRFGTIAGVGLALAGLIALAGSQLGGDGRLKLAGAMMLVAGVLEIAVGLSVQLARGRGMAFTLGGVLTLCFGVFAVSEMALSAEPVALLVGVYFLTNGVFRALDVGIDRPAHWVSEVVYAAVAMVLGFYLCATWNSATSSSVAALIGVEILARAFAVVGGVRHMDLDPLPPPGTVDLDEDGNPSYGYRGDFVAIEAETRKPNPRPVRRRPWAPRK